MAVRTGWSNTVLGNVVVVMGSGTVFATLYAWGAPVWTAVVMVAGAGLILLDQHLDQQHHQEFAQFAEQHGWTYTRHTEAHSERFPTYPFGAGLKRNQTGVLDGIYRDHYCVSFTHHWTDNTEPGKASRTHDFQVTLVEVDADFPRLDVVPANVGTVVQKLVGGKTVEVDVDGFDQRCSARTQDPNFAREILTTRLVERLLEPDAAHVAFRLEGNAVMMWQEGSLGTASLTARLDLLLDLVSRIPADALAAPRSTQATLRTDSASSPMPDEQWQEQWFSGNQRESS